MLTIFFGCLALSCQTAFSAEKDVGLATVIKNNKVKVAQLLSSLNLASPGMSKVGKELKDKGEVGACKALLDYFRSNTAGKQLRERKYIPHLGWANGKKNLNPDDMIKDKYTIKGIPAVIPRDANGYLKWNYIPPNGYKQYPTMLARFRHTGVAWNK